MKLCIFLLVVLYATIATATECETLLSETECFVKSECTWSTLTNCTRVALRCSDRTTLRDCRRFYPGEACLWNQNALCQNRTRDEVCLPLNNDPVGCDDNPQ